MMTSELQMLKDENEMLKQVNTTMAGQLREVREQNTELIN